MVITTENAYSTMLPVNFAQARAPLCKGLRDLKIEERCHGTDMVERRYLALVRCFSGEQE
jgi:hypothetical protein